MSESNTTADRPRPSPPRDRTAWIQADRNAIAGLLSSTGVGKAVRARAAALNLSVTVTHRMLTNPRYRCNGEGIAAVLLYAKQHQASQARFGDYFAARGGG